MVAPLEAVQTPEKGVRISLATAADHRAWFLPFLGEAQEVEGQRHGANLVFVLPDIQKGAVVWLEAR